MIYSLDQKGVLALLIVLFWFVNKVEFILNNRTRHKRVTVMYVQSNTKSSRTVVGITVSLNVLYYT